MRILRHLAVCAALGWALAGCSGGGNDVPQCRLTDPAKLANSSWPRFRHDPQNTGHIDNIDLSANRGQLRWVFPALDQPAKGAFSASPVFGQDGRVLYIGSNDGTLYALDVDNGGQPHPGFDFSVSSFAAITSSAVVGVRSNGKDAIFVGTGDGTLLGLDDVGMPQPTNWPFLSSSAIGTSPALDGNGIVYTASLAGLFSGVCPNGVDGFSLSTVGVQSSPAIGFEGRIYFGDDDQQLRALSNDGVLRWSFAAAGVIFAAPVVEGSGNTTTAVYVADRGGHVFQAKVGSSGLPTPGFRFPPAPGHVGPIASSPALAGTRLYVGSDDGNLYALDTQSGTQAWTFPTGAPIISSPAIATLPATGTTAARAFVTFGSNDGNLYVVEDLGSSAHMLLSIALQSAVRSSPAIGSDGTIYVGTDGGRVYALQ